MCMIVFTLYVGEGPVGSPVVVYIHIYVGAFFVRSAGAARLRLSRYAFFSHTCHLNTSPTRSGH